MHILKSLSIVRWHLIAIFAAMAFGTASAQEIDVHELRMNQIQVIGSHNSYKAAIEPKFYREMLKVQASLKELDYAHIPLTDQLNLGLRSLEIDVLHDPQGGRYAKPIGAVDSEIDYDPDEKMKDPGFKVLHVQDLDFRSHCLTLKDALAELSDWSKGHPRHLPIVITFNLKDQGIPLPGSVKPLPFDREALDLLDKAFLAGLGKAKLIVPDDVRGEADSLESAILNSGWPRLDEARGRFLLMMDQTDKKKDDYLIDHPSLKNRVMFVDSPPGNPESAVLIRNSPKSDGGSIKELVKRGYLVRTRADAGTTEARSGDYSRFDAAKESGAQIISTDYYVADWRLNPAYRVRFGKNDCFRENPVNGPTTKPGRRRLE